MSKSIHNEGVPRPGDKIHIPLPEDEALRLLGKVKPTKDMPRPGSTGKKKNLVRSNNGRSPTQKKSLLP